MKYAYPAIFHSEPEGGYSVSFPDIEGCFTQGDTELEAIDMAEDALNLMLWDMEEHKEVIPLPSKPSDISLRDDDFIMLIKADTLEYKRYHDTKTIKKTLTIPQWLDTAAKERNVNFSHVLTNALIHELHLKKV
jgi:predicted RNase H-like HicB family nuclease